MMIVKSFIYKFTWEGQKKRKKLTKFLSQSLELKAFTHNSTSNASLLWTALK